MNNIILIGMPGVGKSTVGVQVAKQLGLGFVDTDILIQQARGERLSDIIRHTGLDGFCDIESHQVQQLNVSGHVVATGGSVIYRDAAMAHLKTLGAIVFMAIGLANLTQRVSNLRDRGVVLGPGMDLATLFTERQPLYQRHAQIIIDCTHQTADQVATAICDAVKAGS